MTWREQFAEIIWDAVKDMPEDATLEDRKRAVQDARPYWVNTTSHGKKSWQAARRDYLIKYGYIPKTKPRHNQAPSEQPLPLFD